MTCVHDKENLKDELFQKAMVSMEATGLYVNQNGAIYGISRREFPINLENNQNLEWDCGDLNWFSNFSINLLFSNYFWI